MSSLIAGSRLRGSLCPFARDNHHARGPGCKLTGGSWREIRMQRDHVGKGLLLHMLSD